MFSVRGSSRNTLTKTGNGLLRNIKQLTIFITHGWLHITSDDNGVFDWRFIQTSTGLIAITGRKRQDTLIKQGRARALRKRKSLSTTKTASIAHSPTASASKGITRSALKNASAGSKMRQSHSGLITNTLFWMLQSSNQDRTSLSWIQTFFHLPGKKSPGCAKLRSRSSSMMNRPAS